MKYFFESGDVLTMKKEHPCGSNQWEILRVGAEFRLQCKGCSHQVMLSRQVVEKNTKKLEKGFTK